MPRLVAPLLVALSLLVSTATAHAECAWVLWTMRNAPAYEFEFDGDNTRAPRGKKTIVPYAQAGDPYVRGAYATRSECLRAAGEVWVDGWAGDRHVWFSASLVCLPDTIDPRGPKTK